MGALQHGMSTMLRTVLALACLSVCAAVTEYNKALLRLILRSFVLIFLFACALFAAEVLGPIPGSVLL